MSVSAPSWEWEEVKEGVRSLRGRLGFEDSGSLRFLGYRLDLETGEVEDEVLGGPVPEGDRHLLYYVLLKYSEAEVEEEEKGEYKTLQELFGSSAAEIAIRHNPMYRAYVKRLEQVIGEEPEVILRAVEPLRHEEVEGLGDVAVKVYALPKVPVILIAYAGEEGIPASVNVLYDSSVMSYIPDPEVLSMLTSIVLKRVVNLTARA